jgi:hypothetical protein
MKCPALSAVPHFAHPHRVGRSYCLRLQGIQVSLGLQLDAASSYVNPRRPRSGQPRRNPSRRRRPRDCLAQRFQVRDLRSGVDVDARRLEVRGCLDASHQGGRVATRNADAEF